MNPGDIVVVRKDGYIDTTPIDGPPTYSFFFAGNILFIVSKETEASRYSNKSILSNFISHLTVVRLSDMKRFVINEVTLSNTCMRLAEI